MYSKRKKYSRGGAIANQVVDAGLPMLDMVVPGLGTGLSLGKNLFIDPLIAKQQQEKLDEQLYKKNTQLATDAGTAFISSYPTQGVKGVSNFAMGGRYKKHYSLGGAVNLSPNMYQMDGATHEQGGIDLDTGEEVIEVEDDEVVDTEKAYIYSDRLKPSKEESAMLKSIVGKEFSGTYADIAAKLGKMKGKYEINKDLSEDSPEANTAKLMNERISDAEQFLIQTQEEKNGGSSNQQEFKNGGMYSKRKYNRGGDIYDPDYISSMKPKSVEDSFYFLEGVNPDFLPQNLPKYVSTPNPNAPVLSKSVNNTFNDLNLQGVNLPFSPTISRYSGKTSPTNQNSTVNQPQTSSEPVKVTGESNKRNLTGIQSRKAPVLAMAENFYNPMSGKFDGVNGVQTPSEVQDAVNQPTDDLNLDIDVAKSLPYDLANIANTIANANTIEQMQTRQEPQYVEQPRYNYRDRSGLAFNRNRASTQAAIDAVQKQTPSASAAFTGNALAKELQANNQIANEEAQREVAAQNAYQQARTSVSGANAQIGNTIEMDNLSRFNDQLSLKQDNRNNLISSVLQNQQNEEFMRMEGAKALMIAASNNDTGTLTRLFNKYPQLLETLNLSRVA